MVVRFRGSHQEAPAPYKTLLQFIREHSLPITGFYREITRLLFPHLQQSPCLLILDFQHGTTIFSKGQILRSTPNTAPLICGAYNTQPEGLSTMA